jgi:hypothetical protein
VVKDADTVIRNLYTVSTKFWDQHSRFKQGPPNQRAFSCLDHDVRKRAQPAQPNFSYIQPWNKFLP